jgi:hypothetical protein
MKGRMKEASEGSKAKGKKRRAVSSRHYLAGTPRDEDFFVKRLTAPGIRGGQQQGKR